MNGESGCGYGSPRRLRGPSRECAKIAFASSFNLLERGDLVEGTMGRPPLIGRYGLRGYSRPGGALMSAARDRRAVLGAGAQSRPSRLCGRL
jgi:hypothetical protein